MSSGRSVPPVVSEAAASVRRVSSIARTSEKSSDSINACAMASCRNTGYNEISLSALSISDYSEIDKLVDKLLSWTENEKISLSLPSMRIDAFYEELMKKVMSVRKSGLTFAPEAGTQRLRDVINKNITEEEMLSACKMAFDGGRSQIKLYFMLGLPTETDEDLTGIAALGQSIVDEFFFTETEREISQYNPFRRFGLYRNRLHRSSGSLSSRSRR